MALAPNNLPDFDMDTVPEDTGRAFDLIPHNTVCICQIVEHAFETSRDGQCTQLKLVFQIIEANDPKLVNRKVWERVTYHHADQTKQQSVDIGKRFLKKCLVANGVTGRITDWDVVQSKALWVKVTVQPKRAKNDGSGEFYDEQNRIGDVQPYRRLDAPPAQQAPRNAPPPRAPDAGAVKVVDHSDNSVGQGGIPDSYDPPF